MFKIYGMGLLLLSTLAQADNAPSYDFNTGILDLPFVNTKDGAYQAQLQIGPNGFVGQVVFTLSKLSYAKDSLDVNQSPNYNIDTGLLLIPYVVTSKGSFSASLNLKSSGQNTSRFDLIKVNNYVAPRFNKIQACTVFPADNIWNTPVEQLKVHGYSDAWVNSIGYAKGMHMDFGSGFYNGGSIGIPYNVVKGSLITPSTVSFASLTESDHYSYPIPNNPKIEYGVDKHLIVVDNEACQLYEMYNTSFSGGAWRADSGAVWKLHSNQLRPEGWTSADAAGLPIFAGLIRYDEVASGYIGHAIRFTMPTSRSYVWPARHLTWGEINTLTDRPPFGARFRLKASYDISGFPPEIKVILQAMKTFGIMAADHGSGWFIGGEPDERWNNQTLKQMGRLKGSDFEAVDTACLMVNIDSAQADLSKCQ